MKQIKNILLSIAFIALLVFPFSTILPQSDSESDIIPEEIQIVNTERILLADKVNMKVEIAVIDSIQMQFELDKEEEMSPADDLYDGQWNNQYLKAYSNASIPDSFRINLSSFVMPVKGRITSPFGIRRNTFHYGTDLKLQTGDTVYTAFEGKVRVKQYEKKGYGYYLVLRHPNGLETVYGHLSKFLVNIEDTVEAGQPIALGGNTGRSSGSHLHFECRLLGQAINPAEIIDLVNFCTFEDSYLFRKPKVNNKGTITYAQNGNSSTGSITYHRIQGGDTLYKISRQYQVSVAQLCRLNGITPTTTLRIGRILRCW